MKSRLTPLNRILPVIPILIHGVGLANLHLLDGNISCSLQCPYRLSEVIRKDRDRGFTAVQKVEVPTSGGGFKLSQDAGHVVVRTGNEKRFAVAAKLDVRTRFETSGVIQDILRTSRNPG